MTDHGAGGIAGAHDRIEPVTLSYKDTLCRLSYVGVKLSGGGAMIEP